jgi:hypothetical protein
MAPLFSTLFLSGSPGSVQPYTVPAGHVAVVRCVTAYNNGGPDKALIAVAAGSPSVNIVWAQLGVYPTPSVPAYLSWDIRVVVNAGGTISLGGNAFVVATVSGYLLSS